MNKLLQLSFVPTSADLALLLVRLWYGILLFFNHGWEKLANFSGMSGHFSDPIGVGPRASLLLAALVETVCPILFVLGYATRLAALFVVVELGVAFTLVHHWHLAPGRASGELAFLYLGGALTVLIAGPGKYSIDG